MSESQSPGAEPQDPWEEEIDLRELARGVGRKWPVWIFLPIIVMVIVAGWLLVQPQQYEVTTIFQFERDHPGVEQLEISFPTESVIRHRLLARSTLGPLYRGYFDVGEEDFDEVLDRFRSDLQFEKLNGVYRIALVTDRPESATGLLNEMVDTFTEQEVQRQREKLERRLEIFRGELEHVRDNWNEWKQQVAQALGAPPEEEAEGERDELVRRLTRGTGPIPQELEILQRNQTYLERVERIEEQIFWSETLLNQPAALVEHYPAESPGDPIEQNRRRNTLLAGIVTGLLALFGTVFWELL